MNSNNYIHVHDCIFISPRLGMLHGTQMHEIRCPFKIKIKRERERESSLVYYCVVAMLHDVQYDNKNGFIKLYAAAFWGVGTGLSHSVLCT